MFLHTMSKLLRSFRGTEYFEVVTTFTVVRNMIAFYFLQQIYSHKNDILISVRIFKYMHNFICQRVDISHVPVSALCVYVSVTRVLHK